MSNNCDKIKKQSSYDANRMKRYRRRKRRRADIENNIDFNYSSSEEHFVSSSSETEELYTKVSTSDTTRPIISMEDTNEILVQEDSDFSAGGDKSGANTTTDGSEDEMSDSNNFELSDKLYNDSPITVAESAMLIMTFLIVTKIPWMHAFKLLTLIKAHLPISNKAITSVYKLQKTFSEGYGGNEKIKRYCIKCKMETNENGLCSGCNKKCSDGFLIMPVEKQVSDLFQREDIINNLQLRFHKNKFNENNFEDISDGNVYTKYKSFLCSVFNFSMTWYTDGVQVFKSSKNSLWPFLFTINELPYKVRFQPQNIIFGGIWFGKIQPDFSLFLRPLYDSLQKLYNGIRIINIPYNGIKRTETIRGLVLCGTCDLPAKSKVLNSINFNGYYACLKCMIKGVRDNQCKVFTFPFENNIAVRTSEDTINFGVEADLLRKTVFGSKGSTIISKIVPDFIKSTGCDVMHLLTAGIGRKLIFLWFSNKYKKCNFSMFKHVKLVDVRLTSIRPPYFVQRYPRSIENQFKFWKSSDVKNWIFYYSIPCLLGIMKDEYLNHYLLLVQACYILCRESISNEEIMQAQISLEKFVADFASLYMSRFLTANVHQLLHLAECVRDLGPLYFMSCFPYEDLNGKFTRMVHGTSHPALQISTNITFIKKMPIIQKKLSPDSHILPFLKALNCTKKINITEEIFPSIFVIGKLTILSEETLMLSEALHSVGIYRFPRQCYTFKRFKKDNFINASRSYKSKSKNLSYCVAYGNNIIGFLECLLKAKCCNCFNYDDCDCIYTYLGIVQNCQKVSIHANCNFLFQLYLLNTFTAVKILDFKEICFCNVIDDNFYVVCPVNNVEFE